MRELRPVREFRATRRGIQEARAEPGYVKRGQLETHLLALVTLALVAFGLVMVYSATSAPAAVGGGQPMRFLIRQAMYAALGLAALLVLSRIDFRRLKSLAPSLVIVSLVLLAAVLVLGLRVNGARRWINVGPLAFQPSELAKISLCIWAAVYFARRPPPRSLRELARPLGILTGLTCLLVLAEPDLGTAIAIVLMLGGVLLVSGAPSGVLLRGGALIFALSLAAIWLEPYRRARLFGFLHPWNDAQGSGFQSVQALIGLGSGGIFGVGLGQGVEKIFYLPEAHTDMIFATVGEELGLVGTSALIGAYALFAYAGLRIALTCRDPFGKRLAAGLTVLVCGQAALNVAAVVGIAPLTGITLPFVSYGGSSLVLALASVGILLNIGWSDAGARSNALPDRGRGNRRPRTAGARSRASARGSRRRRDVRRVAGSGRVAAGP
ncbi:MAG: putative lipid II flippase FtsW [Candidatus Rokuibacteriota bacterium]|nr:MAG: putative lipid II flippase FtsW [Candidatus Rokubacteria bacterium]